MSILARIFQQEPQKRFAGPGADAPCPNCRAPRSVRVPVSIYGPSLGFICGACGAAWVEAADGEVRSK